MSCQCMAGMLIADMAHLAAGLHSDQIEAGSVQPVATKYVWGHGMNGAGREQGSRECLNESTSIVYQAHGLIMFSSQLSV